MGEHRVSIKIQFSMHGFENEWDAWLNWSDTIPEQVADWIEKQKDEAMSRWWNVQEEYTLYDRALAENEERDLLKQLKEKYDAAP